MNNIYKLFVVFVFVLGIAISPLVIRAQVALPSIPTGLTAVPMSPNKIVLSWDVQPNIPTGFSILYGVYRDNLYTGIPTFTKTGMRNTLTDTGLSTSTTYRYRIVPFYVSNGTAHPWGPTSETVSTTTFASKNTPSTVTTEIPLLFNELPAVTGIRSTDITSNSVKILWNFDSRVGGYRILRSGTGGIADLTPVGTSINGIAQYIDTNLTPNSSYLYTVIPMDHNGNAPGSWSNSFEGGVCCTDTLARINVKTLMGPAAPTPTPTPVSIRPSEIKNLKTTPISTTAIKLTWDYADDIPAGYYITYYLMRDGFGIPNANPTRNGNTMSWTNTGLKPGTEYTFYVTPIYHKIGVSRYDVGTVFAKMATSTLVSVLPTPKPPVGNPSIKIISPNGGESYELISSVTFPVSWSSVKVPDNNTVSIKLKNKDTGAEYTLSNGRNSGSAILTIRTSSGIKAGIYSLIIRTVVSGRTYTDESDGTIIFTSPSVIITTPTPTPTPTHTVPPVGITPTPTPTPTSTPTPTPASERPTVDLKANGSDGPVSIVDGEMINLSWMSTGTSRCVSSRGSGQISFNEWKESPREVTGSISIKADLGTHNKKTVKTIFSISCTPTKYVFGRNSTVKDSVTVNIVPNTSSKETSMGIISSKAFVANMFDSMSRFFSWSVEE